MGPSELLALSLGLSVAVAAAALVGGRIVEALSADPRLRDRMWAAALVLPVLPPLAVGLILLTPPPVREIPAAPAMAIPVGGNLAFEAAPAAPGAAWTLEPGLAFMAVLGLAILLTLARSATLALRGARLRRLIREARDPDPATFGMVLAAARALSVPAPPIGVSDTASEPLLAGLRRPRLILPHGLLAAADPAVVRAMIAHELVHLKRGDHRALWLEEVLLALLAINPLMPVLRARRAAAREEVCDALALADAAAETRRAYAESLIGALRSRAGPQPLPALTFTGAGRRTAMRRLKAVLNPVPAAGGRARLTALGLGGLVAVLAGVGSMAVADEREAVVRVQPAPVSATTSEQPRVAATDPVADAPRSVDRETAQSSLTPAQRERFRNPTGPEFQAICASSDPADDGFCAGVIFSQIVMRDRVGDRSAFCLPADLDASEEATRRSALGELVTQGKAEIARAFVRQDDRPGDLVRLALARAYPCEAAPGGDAASAD